MDQFVRRATLVALAACSIVVAACGGGPASASPSTGPAADTPAPSTAASPTAAPTEVPSDAATDAPSDAPSASTDGSDGGPTTGRIEVPDSGIAVTLPDGWTRIDLSAQDLEAILEAAGGSDPALAAVLSEQVRALAAAGLTFFAIGDDIAEGETMNVLSTPSMGISLDLIESLNESQLQQVAVEGTLETDRVTLPAGEAIRFAYDLPGQAGAQASVIQYALISGDRMVIVSVSGADTEDVEAIAESIETLD